MSTQTCTFRGRSLAELLPGIRNELGPDAVITRQREGLQGGFAGFFQKQFVEVEAHPGGGRRVDVYDEGLSAPAIRELMAQASPFADELAAASGELATANSQLAEAEPERQPAPGRRFGPARPSQADAVEQA